MLRPVLTPRLCRAAARLAREQETPFFLFNERELLRQARAWRGAAGETAGTALFYP